MGKLAEKIHTFQLRPVVPADTPFLWQMLYHALYAPPGSPPPQPDIIYTEPLARYVQDWGRPHDFGLLALDVARRRPVGAAWVRLFSPDCKGYGYIDPHTPELSVAVLPQFRNRGLGTHLLTALFAQLQQRYPAISLSVSVENPASRLYLRLGFEIVTQSEGSSVMRKMLQTSDTRR